MYVNPIFVGVFVQYYYFLTIARKKQKNDAIKYRFVSSSWLQAIRFAAIFALSFPVHSLSTGGTNTTIFLLLTATTTAYIENDSA